MARRIAAHPTIRLERGGTGRLQDQVYAGIRAAIVAGAVRPGERVGSSRALAVELGASRTTTQVALERLEAEGYLVARRGSGTYVADELPDERPGPPPSPLGADRTPPLSARGAALAAGRPPSLRIAGPPRAFRIGVPALELFPVRTWARLAYRRVAAITTAQLDYGEAAGLGALREAIADHVRLARGVRCEAEDVYIVGGVQRGLNLLGRLLLDPGDRALVEEPGYPGAWSALAAADAEIALGPVDGDGLRVPRGESARLAYVTPSHQFPLGVAMTLARRTALLDWARAAGAWIVEDDYDSEFRYGTRPMPCLQGLDDDGRVVYLGSFSKALCPALRLGFIVAPGPLRERLMAVRRVGLDPQPPFLDQAILADFIAGGHLAAHVRRARAVYRERLECLAESAQRLCAGALAVRRVGAGLHAVADLDGIDERRAAAEAFRRGVEVMPLSAYRRGGEPTAGALVLGFGSVGTRAIVAGMRPLAAALEAAREGRGERRVAT